MTPHSGKGEGGVKKNFFEFPLFSLFGDSFFFMVTLLLNMMITLYCAGENIILFKVVFNKVIFLFISYLYVKTINYSTFVHIVIVRKNRLSKKC